jgi:predicted metal-dependent phosphoesterase TrpH
MRADLHVHTLHSRVNGNVPFLGSRDCYSRPEDVYRVARARGMDLVAITDHDSIDGCLELRDRHPDARDVIVGEEITCRMPHGDIEVHLGAWGMTERLHRELQPLRRNVFDVTARLREAGVLFSLNHLLHFYRDQAPLSDYLRLLDEVPALEVRNGTMLRAHNALMEALVARSGRGDEASETRYRPHRRRLAGVAGSDAHTLRRVGRTWTEAPGRSASEFLANVGRGLGRAGGTDGTALTVAADAYGVIASFAGSLVGVGPSDHRLVRRACCLAFVALSLPFEFLPLVIAGYGKRQERRQVVRARAFLDEWLGSAGDGREALHTLAVQE